LIDEKKSICGRLFRVERTLRWRSAVRVLIEIVMHLNAVRAQCNIIAYPKTISECFAAIHFHTIGGESFCNAHINHWQFIVLNTVGARKHKHRQRQNLKRAQEKVLHICYFLLF